MHISQLNYYPLKSARAITLEEAVIGATGIPGDRRMMITDETGMFITQRDLPILAKLSVIPQAKSTWIAMDGQGRIEVHHPDRQDRLDVVIWKSPVSAAVADTATNNKLSQWLGRQVRLVFFDEEAHRHASEEWAGDGTSITFVDGYQILITTTASLGAINADMRANGDGEVGMERFRPNIVIETDEPWAEDRWASIEISGITFDLVKPCARCIMTTQDQKTGSRAVASPMPSMGRMRMSAERRVPGPLFGWNAVPRNDGKVKIGDPIRVTAERNTAWPIRQR